MNVTISLRKIFALILYLCLCMSLMPAALAADADSAPALSLSETESFDAATGVLINANTFPDPIFRRYVEENCDTNGDLVLTAEEIAAVKEMDVSGLGISSLDGIWEFPYLTVLNCSENCLRSLDVSDLPYLEYLYCQRNFVTVDEQQQRSGLESLIPSRALKVLWCYDNNLTGSALRLNRCPDLEYIDCSYNPIGSLNLSAVPKLQELRCNNASLTAIDLSYTPDLHVLWCWDELDAYSMYTPNKIQQLNLAVCPGLANVVLNGVREEYFHHAAFFDGEYEVSVTSSWEWTSAAGIPETTLYLGGNNEPLTVRKETSPYPEPEEEVQIVKIDEKSFPDETFRAQVKGFDNNNDDYLSDREINNVYSLNVQGNPASLKGIEYFNRIGSLHCWSDALTALDVSGFTRLYYLGLDDCKALTSLNLSGCTSLTSLSVHDLPSLTSLDVSGCTGLTNLECYADALTSLNVSGCTALRSLNCLNNRLETLNVGACKNLRELLCDGNKLKTLDLSGNTMLTTLNVTRNQLEGLNVSALPALTTLYCSDNAALGKLDVSHNTALKTLICYSSGLTALDVTKNLDLVAMECTGNRLTALDVSPLHELASLSCGDNQIAKLDLSANPRLLKAIAQGVRSETDNWLCYNYDNAEAYNASPFVERPAYLVRHDKSTQVNTVPGAPSYLEAHFPDTAFRNYVRDNIDLNGDRTLSEEEINAVTELDVSAMFISDLTGINVFRNLRVLNCSWNLLKSLDVSGLPNLEELYCQNNSSNSWYVYYNTSDARDSRELALQDAATYDAPLSPGGINSLIIGNAPLRVLWCYDDELTSLDVSSCQTLEVLDCAYNGLSTLDVSRLPHLKQLMCHDNNLNALDVSGNPELTALWCWGNAFDELNIDACPKLVRAARYGSKEVFTDRVYYSTDPEYGTQEVLSDHVSLFDQEADVSISPNMMLTYSGAQGGIPINADTFPDEAFRTCVRELADTDYNGFLSDDEIAATQYLDCSGWQISSLEGVNYLSSLTLLRCRANNLTELDVSGLHELRELDCSYNRIASLNVSGCPVLMRLRATGNALSDLDLSANGELRILWCWENPISYLDLSANPILANVVTNGIQEKGGGGTEIYYDDNDNPHEYQIPSYICYFDNSETTDLSVNEDTVLSAAAYPALDAESFPDEAFRAYVAAFDKNGDQVFTPAEIAAVTEIDCSGRGISSLKGLENFTALTSLDCSNNALKELDISRNNALTTLDCSGNRLTELDTGRNPALTELYCANNALANVRFNNNYALEKLDCAHNNLVTINIIDCDTIAEFITSGIKPTVKDGVTTYSGRFQRGSEAPKDMLLACDSGVTLGDYPIPDCVLPASLQRLEEEALQGCAFRCVLLQKGVTAIGSRAFADSPNLFAVYIPASVTDIAADAFANVSGLTIYGEPDSAAQSFARDQHIPFIAFN